MINSFKGQYGFLSNFYALENPIMYEGLHYMSSEHFYQAMKTTDRAERIDIAKLAGAEEAKRAGSALVLRPDWEQVKLSVMRHALNAKFTNNPELKVRLLATGNEELVEGNYWHDNFWGDCLCPKCVGIKGQNFLGQLLMELRAESQTSITNSLCGPNEQCFENGECWGHLEGVMCKYLMENNTDFFFCEKTGVYIKQSNVYTAYKPFKVVIAGGRNFNNLVLLTRVMDQLLANVIKTQTVTIISGGARGADKLGELYAHQRGYHLVTIPADWDKYGKSAGYRRNEEMLNLADATVCFWDSKSRGTGHMINITTSANKPLRVVNY